MKQIQILFLILLSFIGNEVCAQKGNAILILKDSTQINGIGESDQVKDLYTKVYLLQKVLRNR